jgi:hypothetical protein
MLNLGELFSPNRKSLKGCCDWIDSGDVQYNQDLPGILGMNKKFNTNPIFKMVAMTAHNLGISLKFGYWESELCFCL